MAWPEKKLRSWDDFLKVLHTIPTNEGGKVSYIFRGQANSEWGLEASLTRELRKINVAISSSDAEEIEVALLNYFVATFGQHFPPEVVDSRTNPVLRWSLMQHYRAPTRLLDWTDDLSVAAYFAAESYWDKNGAIWLLRAKVLNDEVNRRLNGAKLLYKTLRSPRAQAVVQLYFEDRPHDRVVAQRGLFTFCHQIFGEQDKIIEKVCLPESERLKHQCTVFCKMIIPKDSKPVFMRELSHRGVTASSLFPGSDGYGKSLLELARMMTHEKLSTDSN